MDAASLKPLDPRDWNEAAARHLLRRAGFGVPVDLASRLAAMTHEQAVAWFVDYESRPARLTEPDWLRPPREGREMLMAMRRARQEADRTDDPAQREAVEAERRRMAGRLRREEREAVDRLKGWWLRRMIESPRPLEEKMTLFWHGHFAVSAEKVRSAHNNYALNRLFRQMAVGNFKTLTYEVGRTPAMLRYLDNMQNTAREPNENWARELMELFTLGEGHYTEADVKNAARAFTGWTTDGERFVFRPRRHDHGEKSFMGRRGNLDGGDVIDVIFEQPAASRFVLRKLWSYFAYPDPEEEIIEDLAATFRESGFELKPVLRRMFLSRSFYGERSVLTRIKNPAELTVSMLSDLKVDPSDHEIVERYALAAMRAMGQDLFYPPNVKGWEGGRAWINTNTLMVRYNLSHFLVNGVISEIGRSPQLAKALRKIYRSAVAGLPSQRRREVLRMERSMREQGEALRGETMEALARAAGVDVIGDPDGPKGFKLPAAPFEARRFFAPADGLELTKIADFLAEYFYGMPVREDQRRKVVEALAGRWDPDRKLDPASWDENRLRGAVHLMLSTAEYQVC